MSSSSEDETLNPGSTSREANTAILKLASKSRDGYMRKYNHFIKWKQLTGAKTFSEEVLLDYFKELAKTKLPPTLWTVYYMLKATLGAKNNINIGNYSDLTTFLKHRAKGHIVQRSKVLSASDVETFLSEAPNHNYLGVKVALIFGVNGACRNTELTKMRVADVQKHSDQLLLVNIMASPARIDRSFMILGKDVEIVEKYMALRPKDMQTDRFFISYHFGKCRRQVIGINNFQKYPRKIASFLKLQNPELYSGHCFRRTAAKLCSSSDLSVIQQLGWRTRSVVLKDEKAKKALEHSVSVHSPGVTVKVERAESGVPFDFIDVEVPPLPTQPPSPHSAPRHRPRPRQNLFSLTVNCLHRQLKRDEKREREEHKRQMRCLREEARRIEAEAECNAVLKRIADVAVAFLERPTVYGGVIPQQ